MILKRLADLVQFGAREGGLVCPAHGHKAAIVGENLSGSRDLCTNRWGGGGHGCVCVCVCVCARSEEGEKTVVSVPDPKPALAWSGKETKQTGMH